MPPGRISRPLRLGVVVLMLLTALRLSTAPAGAQLLPGLEMSRQEIPSELFIPSFRWGNLELAPIFLDGKNIGASKSFISLQASDDSPAAPAGSKARSRALAIHSRLQKYLDALDLFSRELTRQGITDLDAQEKRLREQLLISTQAEEAEATVWITFPRSSRPELLYTVTKADVDFVRFSSSEPGAIAQGAAAVAKQELLAAWKARQPPSLRASALRAGTVLLLVLFTSLALAQLQRWLERRRGKLAEALRRLSSQNAPSTSTLPAPEQVGTSLRRMRSLLPRLTLRQRLSRTHLEQAALHWAQWFLWVLALAHVFGLFPITRPLRNWILGVSIRHSIQASPIPNWPPIDWLLSLGQQATIGLPLLLLGLLMLTSILIRIGELSVEANFRNWAQIHENERFRLRTPTLSNVTKGWVRILIYAILVVIIFYQLHQLGAFTQAVAIAAGFLSFAVSLASQNLLKDLINGILILLEDQYAEGDVIVVGDQGGLVERVSLRVTKLRNLDGELITIPNGLIGIVRNLSSEWSRVNYAIDFDIGVDVDQVLAIMTDVAASLLADPEWRDQILEPPEILGVDAIAHTGITIRMIIKTLPLQQWAVGREYRRRLKYALDAHGIAVGIPRLEVLKSS